MVPRRSLPASMLKAFNESEYCDLMVICGSTTFRVHKVVLCSASAYFKKAIEHHAGRKSEEDCIRLPEDDPEMIRRMIMYLYLAKYDPTSAEGLKAVKNFKHNRHTEELAPFYHQRFWGWCTENEYFDSNYDCCCVGFTQNASTLQPESASRPISIPEDKSPKDRPRDGAQVCYPLSIHASMYALADKYQVENLREDVVYKFRRCLREHWDSDDFIRAVRIVYSTTAHFNRGLRDVVVSAFKKYLNVDVQKTAGTEEKLAHFDELSFLLLKSSSPKEGSTTLIT